MISNSKTVNSLNQTSYQCQNYARLKLQLLDSGIDVSRSVYESFRESISENNLQRKNLVVRKSLKKADHSRLLTSTWKNITYMNLRSKIDGGIGQNNNPVQMLHNGLSMCIMSLLWIKRFLIFKLKGSSKNESRPILDDLKCWICY